MELLSRRCVVRRVPLRALPGGALRSLRDLGDQQLTTVALGTRELVERRADVLCGILGGLVGGLGCLLSLFKQDDLLLGRFVLYDRMAFTWIAPFFVGPVWLVGVGISITHGVLAGRGLVLLGRGTRQ